MSSTLPTVRQSTGLALNDGPTVLGERQARIPTSGKIRPGIKVLTQNAAKDKKAVEIYERGVKAGVGFSAIETELKKHFDTDKSPLVPKNVGYFTVKRTDFAMPEAADTIMRLYAEDRGEGSKLYRFPVIFPVDYWQAVLPHALKAFRRSEIMYWSEYRDGVRYCMTHGKVQMDEQSKRAKRQFGGRPIEPRANADEGRCVPETCAEYQSKKCTMSGSLLFFIPGVIGAKTIELPMTSFYSMQGIRQQLEMMLAIRGRISGTINGKPLFTVTKKQEEVSMIDPETGEAKRVKQWITMLEANIEMTKLFAANEDPDGAGAAVALEGPGGDLIEGEHEEVAEEQGQEAEAPKFSLPDLRKMVEGKVGALGLSMMGEFRPYAEATFAAKDAPAGAWFDDPAILSRVLDELTAAEESDKGAYVAKVRAGGEF